MLTVEEQKQRHAESNHRWYIAHLDSAKAHNTAWHTAHPNYSAMYDAAHLDEKKARNIAWNKSHPEKVRVAGIAWKQAHPKQVKELATAWKKAHPERMKEKRRREKAKRRVLSFVPMNSPFPGCEGHHINRNDVIYIPRALHRSISHNVWTGKNMDKINAKACAWLTEDWT